MVDAPYEPSFADLLALAALGGGEKSDHPVAQAIVAVRAGRGETVKDGHPLILVDAIRALAILEEHAVVDTAYAGWAHLPSGPVHFEAGLQAIMAASGAGAAAAALRAEAERRLCRAAFAPDPQPMAWNSLALLGLARANLDDAQAALARALAAMPGDPTTLRTAEHVRNLRDLVARGQTLTPGTEPLTRVIVLLHRFTGHAQLARAAADRLARLPSLPGHDVVGARELLLRRARELDPFE
jgi:hypothetical protein